MTTPQTTTAFTGSELFSLITNFDILDMYTIQNKYTMSMPSLSENVYTFVFCELN